MSRTLNDIMTGLPEERRQHIEARAATLFEQENRSEEHTSELQSH